MNASREHELATLGGGCFWCLEAVFQQLEGVEKVVSGYAGGNVPDPSYEQVCAGTTGHAEVVQISYNPDLISYDELLDVFFTIHNPTTLNRQGADVGTQYRSVIFSHTPEQEAAAERKIRQLEKENVWEDPIVTQVQPFNKFHRAEERHQNYYDENPGKPYCQVVINPKLAKLRKTYVEKLKTPA